MAIRFRKNQKDLTPNEWATFVATVKAAKAPNANAPTYADIAAYHLSSWHGGIAHRYPEFFPWHREYLLVLESRLQKVNPSVTIPYWDWTKETDVPAPLNDETEWGVTRNPLATIKSLLAGAPSLGGLVSTDLALTDYEDFLNAINGPVHGRVHVQIGGPNGEMSNVEISPRDVLFWLHHGNIDKIWYDWQIKHPGVFPSNLLESPLTKFPKKNKDVLDSSSLDVYYGVSSAQPDQTITDKYIWLPDLVSLPSEINYDVTCHNESDEFLPCFSKNKVQWGGSNPDALSWYLSPHRDDFTFRTNLFGTFPKVTRGAKIKAVVGQEYNIKCTIGETSASYYVNGQLYATATYSAGTIPGDGNFGFAVYNPENISVRNISITTAT